MTPKAHTFHFLCATFYVTCSVEKVRVVLCVLACSAGTYKWIAGNSSCPVCPGHSQAVEAGSVECRCVSGYYRSPDDDKALNCTRQ